VIACLSVAHLDVQLQRAIGVGVHVGLEVVVTGPVLRGVHADESTVNAQRLGPVRGVLTDDGAGMKGVALLEGGNELDGRTTDGALFRRRRPPASIALARMGEGGRCQSEDKDRGTNGAGES